MAARDLRRDHAERVKELDCLRGIAELFGARARRLDDILADAARLVVKGWQYPRHAGVRIVLHQQDIRTAGWQHCTRRMRHAIRSEGRRVGTIEVGYPADRPRGVRDPFLAGETRLLRAIAVLLGTMAEMAERAAELRAGKTALRRKNIALSEVLDHLEEDRRRQARMLRNTIEGVLLPAVARLKRAALTPPQRAHTVELIEGHLRSLATSGPDPGVDRLALRLSPREIEVADLVRVGLTSKEIGDLVGVSAATVERHRHNIRRKLGLRDGGVSLPTYLSGI